MQFYKKWGLAIAVLILAVGITWALKAQEGNVGKTHSLNIPPKSYSVTLSLEQWQGLINGMEEIKNRLKLSTMSSRDVTFINDSLLVIYQSEFIRQIQTQLAAEQKPKDSIPKAKKN